MDAMAVRPIVNLSPAHQAKLKSSAITDDVAEIRGYRTLERFSDIKSLGFSQTQSNLHPALLIPMHGTTGDLVGYQIRPDNPRMLNGKAAKYETPRGFQMHLDVHPSMLRRIRGTEPLIITEGIPKADAAVSVINLPAIALLGVWNFRGSNGEGGTTMLPDWEFVNIKHRDILIAFDSDVTLKRPVQDAMHRLGDALKHRGGHVNYIHLPHAPNNEKQGLDDYLAAGRTFDDLLLLAKPTVPWLQPTEPPKPKRQKATQRTFQQVAEAFTDRLDEPDVEAVAITLGALVANRYPGDPVWLLLIAPPSSGKTELISALSVFDDVVMTSKLTPAAFLSGSSARERAKDATGGVLRKIGERGTMVNKDFGSVLTLHREQRAEVLQTMRDIYDGYVVKDVGVDGGRTFEWRGHCGFIAGVTEAIDDHHAVVAAMGDRYLSLRMSLGDPSKQAGRAITDAGNESDMRSALSDAVAGLVDHVTGKPTALPGDQVRRLADIASLVVLCRSPINRDGYNREVVSVPTPERPARFAKQLVRLMQGLQLVGFDAGTSWRMVARVARDSMPRDRFKVLSALYEHPTSFTPTQLADVLNAPRTSTGRHCEDLSYLGVLDLVRDQGGRYLMGQAMRARWSLVRPEKS